MFFYVPLRIEGHFHGHGQVVGGVVKGFGDLGRYGGVVVLVDALVEMESVVAHGVIRVVDVPNPVEAHVDFIGHEDEIETVVESATREALFGIPPGGLRVVLGEL